MVDVLSYKGFIGSVHFSARDDVFFGKVEGINDLITFEGDSVNELKTAFRYVIDEHIKDCENESIPIENSYNGNLNLELTPDLHRRVAIMAKAHGSTLNAFIKKAIEQKLARRKKTGLEEALEDVPNGRLITIHTPKSRVLK